MSALPPWDQGSYEPPPAPSPPPEPEPPSRSHLFYVAGGVLTGAGIVTWIDPAWAGLVFLIGLCLVLGGVVMDLWGR